MQLQRAEPGRAAPPQLTDRATWADVEQALRTRARRDELARELRDGQRLSERMMCMASGAAASSACAPATAAPIAPNMRFWVTTNANATILGTKSGNGDSLAFTGPSSNELTDAGAAFDSADVNRNINIAGATTPANNGVFSTTAVGSATAITMHNTAGVSQAFPGTWALPGRFQRLIDTVAALVFENLTDASMPPVDTAIAPGVALMGLSKFIAPSFSLTYAGAVAAFFNATDVSFSARVRPLGTGGLTLAKMSAGTHRLQFQYGNSTTMQVIWQSSAGTTTLNLTVPAVASATWVTMGFRFNLAARTFSYYQDGVLVGTSASGTSRTPNTFTGIELSYISSIQGHVFGWTAGTAAWSAADFLAVHNAFIAAGSPT